MKYENLAFLCEAAKNEEGFALENVIINTRLDDVSTLSDSEITEAAETLVGLMNTGNLDEASAQFMLGAVSESMSVLFDGNVFALEGKNLDLMHDLSPLKHELTDNMKRLKKAMKDAEYGDAKNRCAACEKIIDKMEKVLKDSADDGMVSSIIGSIIGVVPIILRTLAASLIAIPLNFIGLGAIPVICNGIYTLKEGIEVTFATASNILKNKEVSWNDNNTYKQMAYSLIKTTKSQLKNYMKILDRIDGGKSADNDIDPASTQKLTDAKASLSESLHGMTSATRKKK